MEPWKDLTGKVVMVTGASSGIGREFCLDLAKAGCRIIAAARRVDRLKTLCDQINNSEGTVVPSAVAVQLDITADGASIEAAVQIAWNAFGRIDALVNNAGLRGSVSSSLKLTEEEWEHTYKTNLRGGWLVSKYVCRRMLDAKQGGGSVINISSILGLNRGLLPGGLAYASSKMAFDMVTKMMALELGVHNIRVNSISPGIFKSEITESLIQEKWFHKVVLRTVPLRNFGTTDPALTSLVRYLIHDSSEYVSGNIFVVDAGTTLAVTNEIMSNCIRSLCNADLRGGFQFGKDVSLPQPNIRLRTNPLAELGGKPASKRLALAFFAGHMHGYLRPILLKHWKNRDPDMRIYGEITKASYLRYMKSSKYCICARGYQVNSPRVVEAIYYGCIPVILSDNYVPPLFETLNWESFAVFVQEKDIPNLKNILLSIPDKKYKQMHGRVKQVEQHFLWHTKPSKYDVFHMILHSVWHNRIFGIRHR